jgi:hypothetical protein
LPKCGKLVLNFEVLDRIAVTQNLGKQNPQLRNVPLAVAQLVDEPALRLLLRGMEVPVESDVGGQGSKALVEDQEWLQQGRYDVLGIGKGVL